MKPTLTSSRLVAARWAAANLCDKPTRIVARTRHQIDKEWIASARKGWKAISKVPSSINDSFDAVQFIDNVIAWLDRLTEDLLFIKGMWDAPPTGGYNSLERQLKLETKEHLWQARELLTDLRHIILSTARMMDSTTNDYKMDNGNLYKWYQERDPRSPMRAFNAGVRERVALAMPAVDAVVSKKLLATLTRYFPKVQDDIIDLDGSELSFALGNLKVVFQDFPAHAHERRGPLSTLPLEAESNPRRPLPKQYIPHLDRAHKMLQKHGLDFLWYGYLFIRCRSCGGENPLGKDFGVGGNYTMSTDEINIFEDPDPHNTWLMIHELGHRYYFKYMTQADRANFDQYFATDLLEIRQVYELLKSWIVGPGRTLVEQFRMFHEGMGVKKSDIMLLNAGMPSPRELHAIAKQYFHLMDKDYQHLLTPFVKGVPATSSYGQTISSEDFAEVFASYVMGRDLTRDQVERFKAFLGRTRRASTGVGSKTPAFVDYDDVLAWIEERAPTYGGKRPFSASPEYKAAYPAIEALYQEQRRLSNQKVLSDFAKAGLSEGDRVDHRSIGAFMSEMHMTGTVTLVRGVPHVKVDPNPFTHRRVVKWNPRWV
jgi:hypothetical protein